MNMARPKRQLATDADTTAIAPSKRQRREAETTSSSSRPSQTSRSAATVSQPTRKSESATTSDTKKVVGRSRKATSNVANSSAPRSQRSSVNKASSTAKDTAERPRRTLKAKSASLGVASKKSTASTTKTTRKRRKSALTETGEDETPTKTKFSVDVPETQASVHDAKKEHERELEESIGGDGPAYWLMKAEPESRITEVSCSMLYRINVSFTDYVADMRLTPRRVRTSSSRLMTSRLLLRRKLGMVCIL